MDDALLVRRFERIGDLFRDRQRLVEGNRATANTLREIVALDEFHHERGHAPAFFQAVDSRNVWMVQGGEHFRFALKSCEPIVISRERWRQDLDRDLTLQLGVGGSVHLPHAAFADLGGDFETPRRVPGVRANCDAIIRPGQQCGRD